jgi:phosphonate transport system permease protein
MPEPTPRPFTRSAPGWLRLALPIGTLVLAQVLLSSLTSLHPGMAFAGACGVAAVVAFALDTRLFTGLLIVGVLAWAGVRSELNPVKLFEQRGRAAEYLLGRTLTEQERADARRQAERLIEMRIEADASAAARRELPGGAPDQIREATARKAAALRAGADPGELEARVRAEEQRALLQMKGGYFPPETGAAELREYMNKLLETVAIAIWGTLIAVVLAVPFALLASHRTLTIFLSGNQAWRRVARWLLAGGTRRGFDAARGFNEFVLALIFVAVLGLGPFAGTLALAVHTFGVLGKVFADAFDTIRKGEVEGVQASGASPLQTVSWAVIPQSLPFIVSQSLLRFESNVRSASVLGLVGAGGIGFLINAKIQAYQYREVATMMILIIIVVAVIDFACTRAMKRLA